MPTDYARNASFGALFKPAVAFFVLAAAAALGQNAAHEPPAELSFLPSLMTLRNDTAYEAWSEVKFPPNREVGPAQRGKHWVIRGGILKETDLVAAWNAMKPTFLKNGWTIVKEYRAGGFQEVLQFSQKGVQAWVNLSLDPGWPLPGQAGTIASLDVIEVVPVPISLTLAAPASTPETLSPDKGDIPYLPPLPGSKFHSGGVRNTPFSVTPPGAAQSEMIAPGSMFRTYDLPAISNCCLRPRTATHSLRRAGSLRCGAVPLQPIMDGISGPT